MKVLLVDDDPEILDALAVVVRFHWRSAEVLAARGGEEALELLEGHEPDVVVLDVSMPGLDGFGVLARLRRFSDVPVLMLTGRAAEGDQVRGLELGADEYVLKPFSPTVLVARIRAVLRRSRTGAHAPAGDAAVGVGPLSVDFARRRVRLGGRPVRLTPAEYRLLHHLARNAGRVLPHEALVERVWGDPARGSANALKALVSRLRAKIEPPGAPVLLESVRGAGYRLAAPRGRSFPPRGPDAGAAAG